MRRKLGLSLNLGPGTGSRLELHAQTTDAGQINFLIEDLSAASASTSGPGAAGITDDRSAGTATALIRFTMGRRANARSGV
jgi:hypothetical protein